MSSILNLNLLINALPPKNLIISTLVIPLIISIAYSQETTNLTPLEFQYQYSLSIEKGDIEKANHLISEYPNIAWSAAESTSAAAFQTLHDANYEESLKLFQLSLGIYQQLGDKFRESRALGLMGEIYISLNKYDTALRYFQDSLKISKEIGDKKGETITLSNIGDIYIDTGDYKKALSYVQHALKIDQEIGNQAGIAASISTIGEIFRRKGDYKKALSYFQDALKIDQEVGDQKGIAESTSNIGVIYKYLGDYDKALKNYKDALKIDQEIGDQKGIAESTSNIGDLYYETGDYKKALSYYQSALKIDQEIGDQKGIASSISNIADIDKETGDFKNALLNYHKALEIIEDMGDQAGIAALLSSIGGIYLNTGFYQQALSKYQKAISLTNQMGNKAGTAALLNGIAGIYTLTGNDKKALKYYQDALNITKEIGHKKGESTTLNNIGHIYRHSGDYKKAMNYYQDSLIIDKELGNKSGEAKSLRAIGKIFRNNKNYENAMTYYQDSLSIERETGNKQGQAAVLSNIGVMYRITKDYKKSMSNYQDSLSLYKEIGDRVGEMENLYNIGYLYHQKAEWTMALDNYLQSIAILEEIRVGAGDNEAKESFLELYVDIYPKTVQALFNLDNPEYAFTIAEQGKSRSFLDLLVESSTGVKDAMDTTLIEKENSLYGRLYSLRRRLKEKTDNEQQEKLMDEKNKLEQELSIIKRKLKSTNPIYAELKYPEPITVDQVQQSILKEGDVLIEYYWGIENIYVFLISKYGFDTHSLQLNRDMANNINRIIQPIKNTNTNKSLTYFDKKISHDVYKSLFMPLVDKINTVNLNKEIKNLIIIPDNILFHLPFEMLVTKNGDQTEYLLENYNIVYASSSSILKPEILNHNRTIDYKRPLLALAPFSSENADNLLIPKKPGIKSILPSTVRTTLDELQGLPYSGIEVENISGLYKGAVYKMDKEATEKYLIENSKGNRYLHLSTHGYLDSEEPMYSGLIFHDDILQTYEIFNLDIDSEIVILSACETGLGLLRLGEGIIGLTRAFMYAGSSSIVVSLWKVSDPSTAALMEKLYKNLKTGMSKSRALTEAKIWMIKESYHTDEDDNVIRHNHPFYWAPFILVGAYE